MNATFLEDAADSSASQKHRTRPGEDHMSTISIIEVNKIMMKLLSRSLFRNGDSEFDFHYIEKVQ